MELLREQRLCAVNGDFTNISLGYNIVRIPEEHITRNYLIIHGMMGN